MMKIFRLSSELEDVKIIDYANTPLQDIIGNQIWEDEDDIKNFSYKWQSSTLDYLTPTCPFLLGAYPIFSSELFAELSEFIDKTEVQIIPIRISNELFYLLNPKQCISGLLNIRKSDCTKFTSGRIMEIKKYVFYEKEYLPNFFKIEEEPHYSFVTGKLAETLLKIKPQKLLLEECKITKKRFGLF